MTKSPAGLEPCASIPQWSSGDLCLLSPRGSVCVSEQWNPLSLEGKMDTCVSSSCISSGVPNSGIFSCVGKLQRTARYIWLSLNCPQRTGALGRACTWANSPYLLRGLGGVRVCMCKHMMVTGRLVRLRITFQTLHCFRLNNEHNTPRKPGCVFIGTPWFGDKMSLLTGISPDFSVSIL